MIATEAAWYVAKVGGGEEPWCCFGGEPWYICIYTHNFCFLVYVLCRKNIFLLYVCTFMLNIAVASSEIRKISDVLFHGC